MAQPISEVHYPPFHAEKIDLESSTLIQAEQPERSLNLVGSNEPQPNKITRRVFVAFSILSLIIILGCIDIFVISSGKPAFSVDNAQLSLESSPTADATLSMQGSIGSNSALHAVQLGSSTCEMKYNNDGMSEQWMQLGSIEGTTDSSYLTFEFKGTEFSSLRHLFYDTAWNRPTGASVRCSIDITVYMYRFMPVPCSLSVEASILAPTAETATLSLTTAGIWAGRTLFTRASTSDFNRTSINPQSALTYLRSLHSSQSSDHGDPRSLAGFVLDMFNHSTPKEFKADASMDNPFFDFSTEESRPPLSSFVIAVPTLTVSATALGDEEGGGRFFFTSSAFQLELMKPELHLQATLSLQCSDAFSLEEEAADESATVLNHCGMPGPSQIWSFYQALLSNRINLRMDAISSNFVTNLAGPHHSLSATIGSSADADAMLQARLASIRSRSGADATDTGGDPVAEAASLPTLHRALQQHHEHNSTGTTTGDDDSFMGFGVSTRGSCVMLDADHVYQLMGCADLREGLMKLRMHLLDEEEVLLAANLHNAWATVGTTEVETEGRLTVGNDAFFQWTSAISESAQAVTSDFTYHQQTREKLHVHTLTQWSLGENNAAHFICMRAHIRDNMVIMNNSVNVDTALRFGLNKYSANMSADSFTAAAEGDYDFGDDMTWYLRLQRLVILLDDKEQVSSTLSMASQRRPVAGDNEMELSSGSTADMMMHFDVKDSDGMSVMNASCAGTYGKALLNRFLTLDHLELFADSQKIFGMSMAGSLDEAGHSAMRMHLTDGNDEQVLSTDNQMTWAKPEEGSHSWGPAGHYNDSEVHLSLHSKTDLFSLLEWNTSVSVDFAENIYAVRVIDVDTAGKPTFRVDGDGYFLKDKGSMIFRVQQIALYSRFDKIFGFQCAIELHEHESFAIGFQVRDGRDMHVVSVDNRAMWASRAADWGSDGAIELHIVGNLLNSTAADWNARVILGYGDNHFHGLITDISDDKEVFRVEGHGQYGRSPTYWRWSMDKLALYMDERKVGSTATSIDFRDADDSWVAFRMNVSDHNDVLNVVTNSSIKWSKPHYATWESAGTIEVTTMFNAFPNREYISHDDGYHWNGNYTDNDYWSGNYTNHEHSGYESTNKRALAFVVQSEVCDSSTTILNLANQGLWELPDLTACTALQSLDIGGNNLQSLPAEIFAIESLTTLDAKFNNLTSVPSEIQNTVHLRTLNLRGNRLSSLPEDIVSLIHLTMLDVQDNRLTSLPDEIGALSSLRELYLNNNLLESLPNTISQLTQLEVLLANRNRLAELPNSIGHLDRLRDLYLDDNKLVELAGSIRYLQSLTTLSVAHNQLNNLTSAVGDLVNLESLYLQDNQLRFLPPQIRDMGALLELLVDENQLSELPREIGELSSLQLLSVSWNNLHSLPYQMGYLNELLFMHLDNNQIGYIPWEFQYLTKLRVIDISSNNIGWIPDFMFRFPDLEHFDYDGKPDLRCDESTTHLNWAYRGLYSFNLPNFEPCSKVQHLDLRGNHIEYLPEELSAMRDLQWLNVADNDLTFLPWWVNSFPKLTYLSLAGNKLEHLPGELGDARSLQELNVDRNDLLDLPYEIGGLINLRVLRASDNYIAYLPIEIGRLSNLTDLYLSYNQLTELPHQITALHSLRRLDADYNQLTHMPTDIGLLISLDRLSLNGNHIQDIPASIGSLLQLRYLYLYWNDIHELPGQIVALSMLRNFDMDGNELSSLPWDFGNLASLEYFSCWYNRISHLPPSIGNLHSLRSLSAGSNLLGQLPTEIGRLSNLNTLYLSNNRLTSVPREIGDLTQLSHLNLNSNLLESLPDNVFHNLTQLYWVQLSYNKLTSIPRSVGQLSNVYYLDISGNQLTHLPYEFSMLSATLRYVYLSSNALSEFPAALFSFSTLTQVDLSYNRIAYISPEIARMTSLVRLYLGNNMLNDLPFELSELHQLTTLDLSRNMFYSLPYVVAHMSNLRNLYMRGNQVSYLPPEIQLLQSLENLDLGNNQLHHLPAYIGNLTRLQYLYLSNNHLMELPLEITQLYELRVLDVSYNRLNHIPQEIFNMPGLSVYTWGNPGYNYHYYYDDNDDGFFNFVGTVAGGLYYILSAGWDAQLLLHYRHNAFAVNFVERAISGREQVRIVGNGEYTMKNNALGEDTSLRTLYIEEMQLFSAEALVVTVGGKLAALGNHTAGANFFDVQVETRVFDSNWGELFYGNATGELNLNAPEGQACYVGGHADTSVADLYAQVDYSGRKYVVLAGAAGDDGESSEATRSFKLPAFMPNLCPKREVPCLNCEVASARPTCEPTVRPTAVPTTWKPSATPTAYPTEDPTVNPTVSPTFHEGSPTPEPTLTPTLTPSESPTRTPTQQPSEKPTQKPTAGPTERPTQTPSLPPTARPSTLVPTVRPTVTITAKPSDSPTLRPTAVPTTAAPTLNRNAPVVSAVATSVTRSTITLAVTFTEPAVFAGTIYCAAFANANGITITTNQQIITSASAKSAGYLADSTGATVVITGRSAVTAYTTYCSVVTINGDTSDIADTQDTLKTVETACCKLVSFTNSPSFVYGSVAEYSTAPANQYVFMYSLSGAPGSALTITPTLTDANGDPSTALSVLPATTSFTSTSATLSGRFVLSGTATVAGTFTVTLALSGASAAEFDGPSQVTVTVINSLTAKPAPALASAKFANSGGSLILTFNAATNKAAIATPTFPCSELFTFTGSSATTCSWMNGNTVRAVFAATVADDAEILPVVNENISLLAAKVKAECAVGVDCSAYEAADAQSVQAAAPDSPVVPKAQLTTAAVVSSCDNVTIDASNSMGSGGRAWSAVIWTVVRADATGIVSVPSILAALNSRGLIISSPINLQRTLFSPATYTVTLTLTNFLEQTASATAIFSLDANPNLPIVNILGPSVRSMSPSGSLQLHTTTTQASCAEKSSTISYRWTVLENDVPISKPSVSQVPSKFNLLPYALTAGRIYTIVFEATARATANTNAITGRASTTVQVVNGAVVIVVVGGYKRMVPVAGELTINASPSYDENVPRTQSSGLSFAWTCKLASAAVYGNDCGAVMGDGVALTSSTLTVDATLLDEAYLYEFQVVAMAADGRSSVAVVSVQPQLGGSTFTSITSVVEKVNPDNRISLSGLVRADNYGLDSTWTAAVDGVTIPFTALTPIAERFTRVAVRNNFKFELLVPGNSFIPGSLVTFRLNAHFAGDSSRFRSFSEISVKINAAPSGGSLVVSPPNGDALTTTFTLSSAGWTDEAEDFPLTYQFRYMTFATQPPLNLQSRSPSNKVSTSLPAGPDALDNKITMMCTVFDASLAANTISTTVVVKEVEIDVSAYISDQLNSFDNVGNVNTVGQLIGNVATTVNKVNCTLAPAAHCATLNRAPCMETAQTCSKCLDGFTGVLGDSNRMCVSKSRRKLQAGLDDDCSADDDCLFGKCDGARCVAPPKHCPSETSDECSGHGTCAYTTRSGVPVNHVCSVMDYDCHARCECAEGYGGKTCGKTEEQMLSQDSIRASLCKAVITVGNNSDASVQLLDSLFGYMDAAYDPHEVFTTEGTQICEDAMRFVGDIVLRNKELLKEMETSKLDLLLKTTAKFVTPRGHNAPRDGSFIHLLMSTLHEGILSSMVNGQSSYSYATQNMRTLLSKSKLDGSSNSSMDAISIAPPPTEEEDFYGSTGAESFIEVVDSSATSPFADSDGYLSIAVMLWGNNPFPNASTIQSAMLRVENYNLNLVRRALAVPADDATEASSNNRELSSETYDYYIVVQLNEPYKFNREYTPEEVLASGIANVTFPECRNFDGAEYTECSGCEVSTYTDHNVTYGCTITNDRRALSTSSGAVSQFGTVIVTPSATATVDSAAPSASPTPGVGEPTANPTAAPTSETSSNSTDNTALIIGLCVGIPVVLMLLCFVVWKLCSSKRKTVVPVNEEA